MHSFFKTLEHILHCNALLKGLKEEFEYEEVNKEEEEDEK